MSGKKVVRTLLLLSWIGVVMNFKTTCKSLGMKVYEEGLTANDIRTILDRHNLYRKAILDGKVPGQPKGIDLNYLQWDEDLAASAQDVANMCLFKHTSVRDERWRFPVGQNFGRGQKLDFSPRDANWTKIIENWFKEYQKYRYAKLGFDYQTTGHYTQLVWADTEYIGCGFNSHDNSDEESDYAIEEIYVCQYGPRGNLMGKFPYIKDTKRKRLSDTPENLEYY